VRALGTRVRALRVRSVVDDREGGVAECRCKRLTQSEGSRRRLRVESAPEGGAELGIGEKFVEEWHGWADLS